MTVTSSAARVTYAGDGATATFTVSFPFLADGHLVVIHRSGAGAETVWTDGVEYTVSGAGDPAGGTVTVAVAPADHRPQVGESLTILRAVPMTQEIDFTEGDPLPAATLESGFDKAVMVDQQQAEELARAIKLPRTSGLSGLEVPEPQPAMLLAWNGDATALVNVVPADVDVAAVSSFIQSLLDDGDAATARATLGALAAAGDGSALTGIAQAGPNRLAPHEGLTVKTASVTTVDVDADAIVVKDAGGRRLRLEAVDLTVAITASGTNGLDVGTEGAARWYALWVIHDGTTVAGLLFESFSAPAMPAGFGFKGLIGAVYNDAAANFVEFIQRGDLVGMQTAGVLIDGSQTNFTPVSLAAAVPPNARSVILNGYARTSSGTANVNAVIAPAGTGIADMYTGAAIYKESTSTNGFSASFPEMILATSQEVSYRVSGANALLTLGVAVYKY
ncbi:MAG: hypothetical protein H6842_13310 [Rhodospirillaceae bacterium]|nr:hypothetical protein [Rhodospirillaceae bacterium]